MTTRALSPTSLRLDLRSRTGALPEEPPDGGVAVVEAPSLRGQIEPVAGVGLDALRAALHGRRRRPHFYWEDADGGLVMGWGAVAWFHGRGASRFDQARAWITEMARKASLRGAPRGPRPETYLIAAGGFAFGAEGGWGSGFEPATFVVPRVLLHVRRDIGAVRIVWRRDDEGAAGAEAVADRDDAAPPAPPPRGTLSSPAVDESLAARAPWESAVRDAVDGIASGAIEKVVLARRVARSLPSSFDSLDALERLRGRHPGCYRFLFDFGQGALLLGASPERLVTLRGVRVFSDAVAGTAPRPDAADREREAVARLRASAKDQWEHAIVVRHIRDGLAPFVTELTTDEVPDVQRLRTLLHLRTRITGRTPLGTHVLSIAARLHPTPAVAGTPREAALAWIAQREPGDRGWYAGAVGWMTAGGDGDFAVALRCAFVAGRRALLAAGAGLVAGSDPSLEWKETEEKLSVMRDAFEDA